MLELKNLQTFIVLAETGNFTRTSELLFMTQPGVSQHIKKLEQECDCELLIRLGKGIQLTEQGRRLYQYATGLKAQQSKFLEELKFDEPFEGRCVIGCSGASAQRIYPSLVQLQTEHPKLNIHLEVAPQKRILSDIEDGIMDLGIITNPADPLQFQTKLIGEESLSLFLPQHLADCKKIAETVQELGLVNHPDAQHYMQMYFAHSGDEALASLDLSKIKQVGYINQLSQILIPIRHGVGFTVLPTSVIAFFDDSSKIKAYPSASPVSEKIYLVQSRFRVLPARYENVIASIQASIAQPLNKRLHQI